jgi:hypothetical protein
MNKLSYLSLGLLTATVGIAAQDEGADFTSRTTYIKRPHFQSGSPERESFFRNNRLSTDIGLGGMFQVVPFGGRTTCESANEIARYFNPFNKQCLSVVEGDELESGIIQRDIDPSHFNIFTVNGNFQSVICLAPRESVVGAGFTYRQAFTCKRDGSIGLWGEIGFPVIHVRNNVNLTERVINNGGGPISTGSAIVPPNRGIGDRPVANMIEAFRQPLFRFGRINDSCRLDKTRVADIEFKLGYDFLAGDCCRTSFYVGAIAPTGNRSRAVNVFEPLVGVGHAGIMTGGNFGYECWCWENARLSFEFDTNTRYYFSRGECRSFDVRDKSWSRYMQVYANPQDAVAEIISPGINVFTARVDVTPRSAATFNSAFVFDHYCGFVAEVGYNFYARDAEKVELCAWPFDPAFVDVNAGFINPARTINHQFSLERPISATTEYAQGRITRADLDLSSASHPAFVSHTFYGSVGYDMDIFCIPTLAAVGASYEFSSNNAGPRRWLVWGKLAMSF